MTVLKSKQTQSPFKVFENAVVMRKAVTDILLCDFAYKVPQASPQRITAMRRKMKRLEATLESGRIQLADVERMYSSWRGNYYRIMSKAQRLNIDNAYNKLIGGRQNEAIRI